MAYKNGEHKVGLNVIHSNNARKAGSGGWICCWVLPSHYLASATPIVTWLGARSLGVEEGSFVRVRESKQPGWAVLAYIPRGLIWRNVIWMHWIALIEYNPPMASPPAGSLWQMEGRGVVRLFGFHVWACVFQWTNQGGLPFRAPLPLPSPVLRSIILISPHTWSRGQAFPETWHTV